MALRNNPARRVPDNPLAGIVRALNQQSRYAQRRRSGVPTVTSAVAPDVAADVSLLQTTGGGAPGYAAPAPGVAARSAGPVAPQVSEATAVATLACTVATGQDGSARVTFPATLDHPVVTATAMAPVAALPVIESVADGVAVLVAYDVATGSRLAAVTLHVSIAGRDAAAGKLA